LQPIPSWRSNIVYGIPAGA